MKVLIIPSWYPTKENPLNGIFFKEQAEALKNYGLEVVVLYVNIISLKNFFYSKEKLGFQKENENELNVYRYNTFNYFPKMEVLNIKYYIYVLSKCLTNVIEEEKNIDIIHTHSALLAGIGVNNIIKKFNIPYIITEHSSKFIRDLITKTQKRYLHNAFNEANAVIAVGNGLRQKISEYTEFERINIIPNILGLKSQNVRCDISKKRFRFFSLGFLQHNKGMDILIDAFNMFLNNYDVELLIGGEGAESENLQKTIDNYNINDKIKLLGVLNRDEVAYNMKNCDCFVLASRFETFGVVFIEALSFGKPVIGTRSGGPDTIINNINGILVEVENVNQLGNAMLTVMESIDLYDSDTIKKDCYDRFSEKAVVGQICDVYNQVIVEKNYKVGGPIC